MKVLKHLSQRIPWKLQEHQSHSQLLPTE